MSVSWLQIERYALDDLDAVERSVIEAALETDDAAREMLRTVQGDERALPELPVVLHPPRRAGWAWASAGLALAAAVMLVVLLPGSSELPGAERTWKGGTLALELARERGGLVVEVPGDVVAGDRFLVRLTCPPGDRPWDVVVFQAGEAFFPLETDAPVVCGNRVALPGAFTVDGDQALTVCAMVDGVPARETLRARGVAGLGEDTVCVSVAGE